MICSNGFRNIICRDLITTLGLTGASIGRWLSCACSLMRSLKSYDPAACSLMTWCNGSLRLGFKVYWAVVKIDLRSLRVGIRSINSSFTFLLSNELEFCRLICSIFTL